MNRRPAHRPVTRAEMSTGMDAAAITAFAVTGVKVTDTTRARQLWQARVASMLVGTTFTVARRQPERKSRTPGER